MHTIIMILTGLCLFCLILVASRLLPRLAFSPFPAFAVLWFIGAAINMGVGVLHAGYSFLTELPIFLVVYGVPLVVALLVTRTMKD